MIKALDKSECNDAIFYDIDHEKVLESYHWNVNYVKINRFIQALKRVKGIFRENELCGFFIEHNSVWYGALSDKIKHNIYIFEMENSN